MIGCLFCYSSKVDWYHSIFFPIIIIEMENGEASISGTGSIHALPTTPYMSLSSLSIYDWGPADMTIFINIAI
jgi:hypothetical protein